MTTHRSTATLALNIALTCSSAWLFVLAFPPHHVRWLAWIALTPFLVSLRRSTFRAALALAALWGMSSAYGVTDWLPPAVARYYGQPLWLGAILFSTAAFLMGAVEYAAFAAFYWWVARRDTILLPVLAGAAWTAAELGRGRLLTGNPWGLLGYTQSVTGGEGGAAAALAHLLVQIADLTGVYGVSFVLAAVSAGMAEGWLALAGRRFGAREVARMSVTATIVVIALTVGAVRERAEEANRVATAPVAVVQGNLDLGSQWRPEFYGANLDVYLYLTRRALGEAPSLEVFWPENAMTFFVDDEPLYRAAIARITGPVDAELIAGAPRFEGSSDPVYFNSAFLLGPDGEVRGRYDKEHLLPFAEYFPFSSSDLLRRSFARVREFTPGRDRAPLATRIGLAAVTICNEAMFPEIVTERVRGGADYLVNLTNDTWIPSVEFAEHQLAIVTMRAVEQRRFLVRASTSGPSAIIDSTGRVMKRTAALSEAILVGGIEPRRVLTPYGRYGDAFAWGCVLLVGVTSIVWRRTGY